MSYLRNILTNVVTAQLDYGSPVYRALAAQPPSHVDEAAA
jgi:hypothetical protein